MDLRLLVRPSPDLGSAAVAHFLSAKVVRLVSQELRGTVAALASLTVERIAVVRRAGRTFRAMLAMNTDQPHPGSHDLSNSFERRPSMRSSEKGSTESSEATAVEIELPVDGQHKRIPSTEAEPNKIAASREQFLFSLAEVDVVEELHNTLDPEKDVLERSACQTAAGRAVWSHVIHDPLAEILAGKTFIGSLREKLMNDRANNSRELAGVMLAVRTLWFDSLLENAVRQFSSKPQVVLLGAGMDARVYRLNALQGCSVFEVDFAKVINLKHSILDALGRTGRVLPAIHAKNVERVPADVSCKDWFQRLEQSGFNRCLHTVWILEGLLYYLKEAEAKAVLEDISRHSRCDSVLLADFMNESSTHLGKDLKTKFYFHSDWPEELLPHLGYSNVKVSQIGDRDANFGLVQDELHIFNQIRKVPRHVLADDDGKPYNRLLLVESTVRLPGHENVDQF